VTGRVVYRGRRAAIKDRQQAAALILASADIDPGSLAAVIDAIAIVASYVTYARSSVRLRA
jgi:hypothetical protein